MQNTEYLRKLNWYPYAVTHRYWLGLFLGFRGKKWWQKLSQGTPWWDLPAGTRIVRIEDQYLYLMKDGRYLATNGRYQTPRKPLPGVSVPPGKYLSTSFTHYLPEPYYRNLPDKDNPYKTNLDAPENSTDQ